jgi:hypothetical protein
MLLLWQIRLRLVLTFADYELNDQIVHFVAAPSAPPAKPADLIQVI